MGAGSTSSAAASGGSSSGTEVAQASSSSATIDELRQEIQEERARTAQLESRLDQIQNTQVQQEQSQSSLQSTLTKLQVGRGNESVPNGASQADIYDRGFFLRSKNGKFSLNINGLMQIRYSFFKPNAVGRYDYSNRTQNDFQIYLGRLAFSGNVFEPSLKYFMQIQGFTTGSSNNMTLLDWFMAKTFSPYLTMQAGRSWTAYTWEFYANPAWLTFPDLSTAEYGFVLPRAIGLAALWAGGQTLVRSGDWQRHSSARFRWDRQFRLELGIHWSSAVRHFCTGLLWLFGNPSGGQLCREAGSLGLGFGHVQPG